MVMMMLMMSGNPVAAVVIRPPTVVVSAIIRRPPVIAVITALFRACRAIAEIKMVRSWIFKIHRALDETQTDKPDIKIEVPLRIGGDRSDVMQSRDFAVHQAEDDRRSNSPRRFGVKSDHG